MSNLAGKVAVVTGASKGIGASIAEHLASAGASVVVNYASSRSGADAVATRINAAGGQASTVQADVSKRDQVGALFTEANRFMASSTFWSTLLASSNMSLWRRSHLSTFIGSSISMFLGFCSRRRRRSS